MATLEVPEQTRSYATHAKSTKEIMNGGEVGVAGRSEDRLVRKPRPPVKTFGGKPFDGHDAQTNPAGGTRDNRGREGRRRKAAWPFVPFCQRFDDALVSFNDPHRQPLLKAAIQDLDARHGGNGRNPGLYGRGHGRGKRQYKQIDAGRNGGAPP